MRPGGLDDHVKLAHDTDQIEMEHRPLDHRGHDIADFVALT